MLLDDGTQYDLMIVYTPAAVRDAGGLMAMDALADLAVESTNQIYANSNVNTRARLVYTEQIAYTESGSVHTDVDRLRAVGDGYLDGVFALRDQYKADLVSLWVNNASDYGGYGVYNYNEDDSGVRTLDESDGFSALIYTEASPGLLAHEIGHNFGCSHDVANASPPYFYPYGYGWRFTGNDGALYRTVMAYDPGTSIPYFSSPSLFYQGVATGVADQADKARAMNTSAYTVANPWRISALPPTRHRRAGCRFSRAAFPSARDSIICRFSGSTRRFSSQRCTTTNCSSSTQSTPRTTTRACIYTTIKGWASCTPRPRFIRICTVLGKGRFCIILRGRSTRVFS